MVAQSRGAKFITASAFNPPHRRLTHATNKDESILNKALQDVADEFDTTGGRYLENLDFWGKDILNRNPRKEEIEGEPDSCVE